jgi:excisionase family DNA binding protein
VTAFDRLQVALAEVVREVIAPELDAMRAAWTEALAEVEQRADGDWIPAERAATLLGCSLPALYARIRRGVIPAVKRGRRWFVSRADLDAEMERKRRRR